MWTPGNNICCQNWMNNNSSLGTTGSSHMIVTKNSSTWILAKWLLWCGNILFRCFSNIQEYSQGEHKQHAKPRVSCFLDPTRKIQEVRHGRLTMGHHTGHHFLAIGHQATEKQNVLNSFLSQHSGSLVVISPGNSSYVSMTAQHYFCVLCYLTLRGWD